MVAPIPPGDTTQWDVLEWAFAQAEHLSSTRHHVLLYLSAHAFYRADNPEGAETGQVMRQASYVDAIASGTSLKRDCIRQSLVDLQMAAYIQRQVRNDSGIHGQQPHRIYVLWDYEEMRQGLRDGSVRLPPDMLLIPSRPTPTRPLAPVLSIVKECDETAH